MSDVFAQQNQVIARSVRIPLQHLIQLVGMLKCCAAQFVKMQNVRFEQNV